MPTMGTPAAMASNSLLGVVRRWFSVDGWIGIATTSAAATQLTRSAGRDCGQHEHASLQAGLDGTTVNVSGKRTVADEHENRGIHERDRVDQLLDPSLGEQPPVVEHDPCPGRERQALVELPLGHVLDLGSTLRLRAKGSS